MRAILLATLAIAPVAATAAPSCDWSCKIRVHACERANPSKCVADDRLPDQTGLCPMMMMGVAGKWVVEHPNMAFKGAECVPLDDNRI